MAKVIKKIISCSVRVFQSMGNLVMFKKTAFVLCATFENYTHKDICLFIDKIFFFKERIESNKIYKTNSTTFNPA